MRISSSSTTNVRPESSTGAPTTEEIYAAVVAAAQPNTKNRSTAQIRAEGEVTTRVGVLWFVGVICVLLLIIGGISLIINPEKAKDVWVIIGPIISSAVTGTVAFLTGEKSAKK